MTTKDYEVLAEVIRVFKETNDSEADNEYIKASTRTLETLVQGLCIIYSKLYKNFDAKRFVEASGFKVITPNAKRKYQNG